MMIIWLKLSLCKEICLKVVVVKVELITQIQKIICDLSDSQSLVSVGFVQVKIHTGVKRIPHNR